MVKLFILPLCLLTTLSAGATYVIDYVTYHRAEFTQGPWARYDRLDPSSPVYLQPVFHQELVGSVPEDFVNLVVGQLYKKAPESYTWAYDVKVAGDSVIFESGDHWSAAQTIKNELTASLILNGYGPIIFHDLDGEVETWTLETLDWPLMDLVWGKATSTPTPPDTAPMEQAESDSTTENSPISDPDKIPGFEKIEKPKQRMSMAIPIALGLSVLLNLGLAARVIVGRQNRR